MHRRSLSADERHADDVLVFLQDLAGRISADGWLPCARAFLDGYGRKEIVQLAMRGAMPKRGVPRLWWAVRTSWRDEAEVRQRFNALLTVG